MDRPLRIVHVLTHANATRGGAIQALLLARAQRAAGHDVRVVANSPPDAALDFTFAPWLHDGMPIDAFDQGTTGVADPFELLRFRRYLRAVEPDVVHVHRDTALVFTWLASIGLGLPALISQRGTTHSFRTGLVSFIHRSKRVDRIVAVAEAVKRALVGFGVEERKVDVVYGSFDLDRFDPSLADPERVRREIGLAPGQPLVVQVGELHKKKNPLSFVNVAQLVRRERPDCVFALAGKGKQEKKVRKAIRKLGLTDGVRLLGFRTDVADVYAAATLAVNCSVRDEGLTGAVREALAMGRPCVATATDGNPEIVREGETGLLVQKGDDSEMARRVIELLADPERGKALGARGRELVLELMRPEVRLRATIDVYRRVLAGQRSSVVSAASPAPSIGASRTVGRSGGRSAFGRFARAAAAILLLSLPIVAMVQTKSVGRTVDALLDDGVVALDEIEDLLQNLSDLRSGVLEMAIESASARGTLVPQIERKIASLRRNSRDLERIDLENISGEGLDADVRIVIAECATASEQFLAQARDPEIDDAARSRGALDVSSMIDEVAGELSGLSGVVDRRARIVDDEVPRRLRFAQHAMLAVTAITLLGLLYGWVERRTRPRPLA